MGPTVENGWLFEQDSGAAGGGPGGTQTDVSTQQVPDGGDAGGSGADQERAGQDTSVGWVQRLLRDGGTATVEVSGSGVSRTVGQDDPGQAQDGNKPAGPKPKTEAEQASADAKASMAARIRAITEGDPNETLTLTRDEVRRAAQSLKDREIAAQNERDQTLAQRRAQAAQIAELKELADPDTGDPDRLAEAVRKLLGEQDVVASQMERQNEILSHVKEVGTSYDNQIIFPLLDMLPQAVRDKLEQDAPAELVGLPYRAWVFKNALEKLREQWTTGAQKQAEQRLRGNDAFKKQVLSDARGGLPEPELIEAAAHSNGASNDNNTWLRRLLRQ